MSRPLRSTPRLLTELSRHRRETASASPRAFTQVYLKQACRLPSSRMHGELFELLNTISKKRGGRLAVAAPRGHAKSTLVSLSYVLWCLLYRHEQLILLVSATAEQAEILLRHVRDELMGNELLIQDFPGLFPHNDEPRLRRAAPWMKHCIRLANGSMLFARGAKASLRGVRNIHERTTLIIADDLEDPYHVREEEQRSALENWFFSTVVQTGDPSTNVIVVGTILHRESLLANLTSPDRMPGWTKRVYRAVEQFAEYQPLWDGWSDILDGRFTIEGMTPEEAEGWYLGENLEAMLVGTKVLWPERESYLDLMRMIRSDGRHTFAREKQNQPLDPEICVFDDEKFVYWDEEFSTVDALLASLNDPIIYGACDPSMGKNKRSSDFSAIVVLAKDRSTDVKYVIAADLERRSPDETVKRILQFACMYRFREFAFEANQFQEVMAQNLERSANARGIYLPLHRITSSSHKHERIAALEPEVAQGRLRFCRGHRELNNQIRDFPLHAHDDGPDALEMAFVASSQGPQFGELHISRWS